MIFKQYIVENKEEINTTDWLQYDQDNAGFLFDIGKFIYFLQKDPSKKDLSIQFEKMLVSYKHTQYFFNKIPLEKSSGISIFVPKKTNSKKEEYDFYKTLSWNNAVNMSNIIDKL